MECGNDSMHVWIQTLNRQIMVSPHRAMLSKMNAANLSRHEMPQAFFSHVGEFKSTSRNVAKLAAHLARSVGDTSQHAGQ